jgi:hypothetical protein
MSRTRFGATLYVRAAFAVSSTFASIPVPAFRLRLAAKILPASRPSQALPLLPSKRPPGYGATVATPSLVSYAHVRAL